MKRLVNWILVSMLIVVILFKSLDGRTRFMAGIAIAFMIAGLAIESAYESNKIDKELRVLVWILLVLVAFVIVLIAFVILFGVPFHLFFFTSPGRRG